MTGTLERICVFCGSSAGEDTRYLDEASRLGEALARRGYGLVYGGSKMGLMGRIADATLEAGGEVIGVIPEPLVAREVAHQGLTELAVVASMHERKGRMVELADAFVALPGGLGTLEEFLEVLTWAQLGFHRKACGILNASDYYGPLISLLDHAVREGFLAPSHRRLVRVEKDPDALLRALEEFEPPELPRWIGQEET